MIDEPESGRSPESEMMHLGWDPSDGLLSLKPPIFETSTFVFESAAAAERLFQIAYGGARLEPGEEPGFIYTRIDHPNLAIVEKRIAVWDRADAALLFSSGTSAIFTALLTMVSPGELILHSAPLYGGTNTLLSRVLTPLGFETAAFRPAATAEALIAVVGNRRLGAIYIETPANPTNDVFDISVAREVADHFADSDVLPPVIVDNTFLGPYTQRPLSLGADLVVYSATKFLGGHSDLVAGAVAGSNEVIARLKTMRYRIGTTCDPHTAWLLGRSLETYAIRAERQSSNATRVADFLQRHPGVAGVRLVQPGGAMISFEVAGGKDEAFAVLDAMTMIGLTTSLGGTESIACHPWSTTHFSVDAEDKLDMGISDAMIRLSIGLEAPEDIIADLDQALSSIIT
ncbi:MAG: aminotransferase class I/II-fold pyridoxal phosphate-dependent enzyme [Acidimicrobiia bacterium]